MTEPVRLHVAAKRYLVATDPGSVKHFEAFSKHTGNELLESGEEGGKFVFLLKKA